MSSSGAGEIDGDEGRFEDAQGLITSNFFVSDSGEVVDNQFGVIFVAGSGLGGGAVGLARHCPDLDNSAQELRNWARLKVVVKTSDGTPIANIAAADICVMFNGGRPGAPPGGQGFDGNGADSTQADPQWSGGAAVGPAVPRV